MKQIILILLILLFLSCSNQKINSSEAVVIDPPLVVRMNLNTDKSLYHSNELMNISVSMDSNKNIPNVTLNVKGIYSKNRYRLDKVQMINLFKGNNVVVVEYKTPKCNTCSGIRQGVYEIIAELSVDSVLVANNSAKIKIKQ
ncbi:hypothetical protein GF327_09680 [Candidatus Woesearchaeota archaeon]|nr:hypothetical protein [Candidatus Woesearchaeota archaeon]